MPHRINRSTYLFLAASAVTLFAPLSAVACPFCTASGQTLGEEIDAADIVVFGQLAFESPPADAEDAQPVAAIDADQGTARFRITKIIKGRPHLADLKEIEAVFFGDPKPDTTFMITGLGADNPQWTTPLPIGAAAQTYISKLIDLPKEGADRLDFFQDYFENEDPMLAQDSYDEFARASFAAVKDLRNRMRHDQLIEWINDRTVPPSHRRLYLTMLSVCGSQDDIELLETMIRSDDKAVQSALDALIACYLTLKGPDGLPLVEERFLKDPEATYKETYSAIMALRFHGQETEVIPRERLLVSMRYLLDNPDTADQVINDLTRWEDWEVMDRLVALFKQQDDKWKWSRVPIVQFLMVASRQDDDVGRRAQTALDELTVLDPDAVKRAKAYFAYGALANVRAKPAVATDNTTEEKESSPADAPQQKQDASSTTVATQDDAAGATPQNDLITTHQPAAATSDESPASPEIDSTDTAASDSTSAVAADGGSNRGEATSVPSRLQLVAVPVVGALALLLVLWLILRGTGQPSTR